VRSVQRLPPFASFVSSPSESETVVSILAHSPGRSVRAPSLWRMRSSDAEFNQIPPARTVQRARIHETLALSAALPAFSSLSWQQCTIAELATRRAAHSAEKAGVQRCCTSAFGVKTGEVW
jgi:hypothetical protein